MIRYRPASIAPGRNRAFPDGDRSRDGRLTVGSADDGSTGCPHDPQYRPSSGIRFPQRGQPLAPGMARRLTP